jgi:hypothetical protein
MITGGKDSDNFHDGSLRETAGDTVTPLQNPQGTEALKGDLLPIHGMPVFFDAVPNPRSKLLLTVRDDHPGLFDSIAGTGLNETGLQIKYVLAAASEGPVHGQGQLIQVIIEDHAEIVKDAIRRFKTSGCLRDPFPAPCSQPPLDMQEAPVGAIYLPA